MLSKNLLPLVILTATCLCLCACVESAANTQNAPAGQMQTKKPNAKKVAGITSAERHKLLYLYEHELMPQLWFGDYVQLNELLTTDSQGAIQSTFKKAQEITGITSTETDSLTVESVLVVDDIQGWLVTFPTARTTPESKYTLLVVINRTPRFFAWEFDNMMGQTTWFLCEWTPDGQHMNYGMVKDGSKESFLNRVSQILASEKSPKPIKPGTVSDFGSSK